LSGSETIVFPDINRAEAVGFTSFNPASGRSVNISRGRCSKRSPDWAAAKSGIGGEV
jgi:hypothetical protein